MTIKQIDQLIEEGQSLKIIAQIYSEIANLKIKRIRFEGERNRLFLQEIAKVYGLVRDLAIKRNVGIIKPKQTVAVIITSNYHFYGPINHQLIAFYIDQTKALATDRIIIGRSAIDYFKASGIFKNYQQVILKKDQPDGEELTRLVNMVRDYNQILVYFSQMKSLLTQVPTFTNINQSRSEYLMKADQSKIKFIFEPELKKILEFFDSQILTLLLEGTFLESEVSRTASRFISMDQAETEANKYIKSQRQVRAYTKRNQDNNRILENFASLMAIRKDIKL